MKPILLIFLCTSFYTHAQTIDKKKVLSIIKAAKNGKPITPLTKENKVNEIQKEPIIVYRRKSTKNIHQQHTVKTTQPIFIKSTLPNIPPTSVILRNTFIAKNKPIPEVKNTPLFKTPIQNKHKGINTTAKKINYY